MQIKEVIHKTTNFFKEKGFSTPRLDAELLISQVMNWDRIKIYMNYDYPLNQEELERCRGLVRRRSQGEPVAYILGKKDFYKSSFKVKPGVLIPRPETEYLVEAAVEWHKKLSKPAPFFVADFGAGSGCVGLSILQEVTASHLIALDLSGDAVEVTLENATALGLSERVTALQRDIATVGADTPLDTWGQKAHVVVANPPYIATDDADVDKFVHMFEPHEALYSGDNGLAHIRLWAAKAGELLQSGGLAVFEIGASQARVAEEIFTQTNQYSNISVVKDLSGRNRYIRAVKV